VFVDLIFDYLVVVLFWRIIEGVWFD